MAPLLEAHANWQAQHGPEERDPMSVGNPMYEAAVTGLWAIEAFEREALTARRCDYEAVQREAKQTIKDEKAQGRISGVVDMATLHDAGERIQDAARAVAYFRGQGGTGKCDDPVVQSLQRCEPTGACTGMGAVMGDATVRHVGPEGQ